MQKAIKQVSQNKKRIKDDVRAEETKPKGKKNGNIKPAWIQWLIIGAELIVVLGIAVLACIASLA